MSQMLAMAVEYSHAEDEAISDRCENWGRVYRDRMTSTKILSLEGRYRNKWARSWDHDAIVGTAPDVRPLLDQQDAQAINLAWQAVPDLYHQMILGGHYVKRWSPAKCDQTARKHAGMDERKRVSDREFAAILDMAHGLLEVQLAIPAVVRRQRLTVRVRLALELDEWR